MFNVSALNFSLKKKKIPFSCLSLAESGTVAASNISSLSYSNTELGLCSFPYSLTGFVFYLGFSVHSYLASDIFGSEPATLPLASLHAPPVTCLSIFPSLAILGLISNHFFSLFE